MEAKASPDRTEPGQLLAQRRPGDGRPHRRRARRPPPHVRRAGRARRPARVGAARRGCEEAIASRSCARTCRLILEAHFGVPATGGDPRHHQHPARAVRGRATSSRDCAPRVAARRPRARAAARGAADLEGSRRSSSRGHRRGRRPVRGVPRRRASRERPGAVRGRRGRPHLDQLHVGHHGQPEGRDVHPPRRLPACPRRRARDRAWTRLGAPVDAADVPLQRLVPAVGGDGGGGHARLPAQGRARRGSGSCSSEGVTHYSGAPTVHLSIVGHDDAAPARAARDRADGRLAAVADAARPHAGAQPAPRAPVRADRDLRTGDGLLRAPEWERCLRTSRPAARPARARPTTARTSSASSTTR